MKRSEINLLILSSINFFHKMNFRLPPWAYWKSSDWKGKYDLDRICRFDPQVDYKIVEEVLRSGFPTLHPPFLALR